MCRTAIIVITASFCSLSLSLSRARARALALFLGFCFFFFSSSSSWSSSFHLHFASSTPHLLLLVLRAETLAGMKQEMRNLFPQYLDTKLLCQHAAVAGSLEYNNLEYLFQGTATSPFATFGTTFSPGQDKYGANSGTSYHEVSLGYYVQRSLSWGW